MSSAKILVVDDEESILNLVTSYLRAEGYETYSASDGPSGLKAAQAYQPDLIVLDILLPGMDGLEVINQLRRASDVYVILLTAKSEETDKVIGLSIGADDYITKPFSPRELMARIKAALRRLLTDANLTSGEVINTAHLRIESGSRQIVAPVQGMMAASRHITEGHYDQRVDIPGDPENGDELAQLALSFNQMAEKLYQTENMCRQLFGDISHELRTPLTTIKGSMEGLIDGVLPPTPETLQHIYQETDRLQRLVADLQELSRVEVGSVPLQIALHNIAPLIESVTGRLRPQFQDIGVSLNVDMPPDLPQVRIDKDRISQVLINLLGNALQYTPKNGKVSLTAQKIRGELQIQVKNTGIGIPVEHLSNLFTRFYRVDKSHSRAAGGSGIGLSIAKHLIEAHGGQIWAESLGSGKGSTFSFTIPIT